MSSVQIKDKAENTAPAGDEWLFAQDPSDPFTVKRMSTGTLSDYITSRLYACRAWVNFDGTGTVAIRASGNVSSIIDRGVGQYTVNFITAMGDENYTFSGGGRDDATGFWGSVVSLENNVGGQPKTVGSARFRVDKNNGADLVDVDDVSIIIIR